MPAGQARVAFKGQITVEKWDLGRDPETDPPDEVMQFEGWTENDELVVDPQRIAELEAQLEQDDES